MKNVYWKKLKDPYLIGLIIVGLMIIFFRLGAKTLYSWDEAIYGQIAQEMLGRVNWLVPYWQNVPWFEKPPLAIWLMAGSFKAFGVSEYTARAASALAGLGCLALIYQFGIYLSKKRLVGLIAGLILISSYSFVHAARFATTDMLLVFFMLLAGFGCYKLAQTSKSYWWYCVAASLSLGFMVKNIAIAPAAIAILITSIVMPSIRKTILSVHFVCSIGLGLLIVVPWHIYMQWRFGASFWSQYFGYHILGRTGGLEGHSGPNNQLYYLVSAGQQWFPWLYMLPLGIVAVFQEKYRDRPNQAATLFLIGLFVLTVVLYQFVATKLPWYILPATVAATPLVGLGIYRAIKERSPLLLGLLFVGFFGISTKLSSFLESGITYRVLGVVGQQSQIVQFVPIIQSVLFATTAIVMVCLLASRKTRLVQYYLVILVCGCALLGVLRLWPLYQNSREFVEPLGKLMPVHSQIQPMIQYKLFVQGPDQIYYTNHIAISMSSQSEVTSLLKDGYQANNLFTALNPIAYDYAQHYLPNKLVKLPKYTVVVPLEYLDELKAAGDFEQLGQVDQIVVGTITAP